jgi:hypothetical protein
MILGERVADKNSIFEFGLDAGLFLFGWDVFCG